MKRIVCFGMALLFICIMCSCAKEKAPVISTVPPVTIQMATLPTTEETTEPTETEETLKTFEEFLEERYPGFREQYIDPDSNNRPGIHCDVVYEDMPKFDMERGLYFRVYSNSRAHFPIVAKTVGELSKEYAEYVGLPIVDVLVEYFHEGDGLNSLIIQGDGDDGIFADNQVGPNDDIDIETIETYKLTIVRLNFDSINEYIDEESGENIVYKAFLESREAPATTSAP